MGTKLALGAVATVVFAYCYNVCVLVAKHALLVPEDLWGNRLAKPVLKRYGRKAQAILWLGPCPRRPLPKIIYRGFFSHGSTAGY